MFNLQLSVKTYVDKYYVINNSEASVIPATGIQQLNLRRVNFMNVLGLQDKQVKHSISFGRIYRWIAIRCY